MAFRGLGLALQPALALGEWGLRRRPETKPNVVLPKPFEPHRATSETEADAMLQRLSEQAPAWVAVGPNERAQLLRKCIDTSLEVLREVAEKGTQAKGSYGYGTGEEAFSWSVVLGALREYAVALEAGGAPRPHRLRRRPDGQWVVDVFPQGLDGLLWAGFMGEVWIQPGQEPTQGALYRRKAAGEAGPGGVALVLGAGNQVPVAALDILHKLLVDDEVVLCKMNPINDYVGPLLAAALAPLASLGVLEFAYGPAAVGALLVDHPRVTSVHLTGSAATFNAIVWHGKPKAGPPPFTKLVSAELGCVTPYIVAPGGTWSAADLRYHAMNLVASVVNNSGHNCLKAEILVTDAAWPQRDAFLDAVRAAFDSLPQRLPYYPGSEAKANVFETRFPDAERLGQAPDGAAAGTLRPRPYLLKAGLAPEEAALDEENWCPVLQEVALPGCDGRPEAFLPAAVRFANERCWGSLSTALIAHPDVLRKHSDAVDQALADLRYGAVVLNAPNLLAFAATPLPWGAFPGNTASDIGSGNCAVHNTYMYDHPQKGVLRAPWRFHPYAFWLPDHRNMEATAMAAAQFVAKPSLLGVLPLVASALHG